MPPLDIQSRRTIPTRTFQGSANLYGWLLGSLMVSAACTCPSFEEMEIVAADESVSETALANAARALADFADWTGDEGVCVPALVLREDLEEPRGVDEEQFAAGGAYRGKHRSIWVDATRGVWSHTFHELCHAIDAIEDHSGPNAALFPDVADPANYSEKERPGENFALFCEQGPRDTTFDSLVAERCGDGPYLSEAERYLDEVVFPDAPNMVFSGDDVSLTVEWSTWSGVGEDETLEDAIAYEGELVVLVEVKDEDGATELWLRTFTADGLQPNREMMLMSTWTWARDPRFVPADEGLYVQVQAAGFPLCENLLYRVDLAEGAKDLLPLCGVAEDLSAISGGVLYTAPWAGSTPLAAWTLDGEPLDLPTPEQTRWRDLLFWTLWPDEGGIGMLGVDALGHYDATNASWALEPGPDYSHNRVDLGQGRSLVVAVRSGSRVLVHAEGQWSVAGDLCDPDANRDWVYARALVTLDGRILAVTEDRVAEIVVGP